MLKINISARGKEHYAVFYPEKEFNEDEFMEEHSEDYMELSDDNIDMEMWNLNMQCCINCSIFKPSHFENQQKRPSETGRPFFIIC